MISAKIQNLRSRLSAAGMRGVELDSVIDAATEEISGAVKTIVEDAVHEVETYGTDIGAEEFLAQIKLDAGSGYIEIATDSGQLDFSTPPLPMLPWLLKSAKVAKDGSRYKVIPVGAESSSSRPKAAAKDIASGLSALSSEQTGASSMAEKMASAFGMAAYPGVSQRQEPKSMAKPEFRVASSKQDATRQWVAPPKDLDMNGVVMSINSKIRLQVDNVCDEVINRYEKEALNGLGNA